MTDQPTTDVDVQALRPVRLEPGDRVLIGLQNSMPREQAVAMRDQLRERFPDVEFSIVIGAVALAVLESPRPTTTSVLDWAARTTRSTSAL